MDELSRYPYLKRKNENPTAYLYVFMDDFWGLDQGNTHRPSNVHGNLFHTLYKVFRPLESDDSSNRKEFLSLKKIYTGDCTWYICKILLGWVVDTVNMKVYLPPHQENYFREILSAIPCTQKQIGVDKWHRVLGKLLSVKIDLPGARGIFSHMQEYFCHVKASW